MVKNSSSLVFVDNFNSGLRTDIPADKLPPGALARAENIRLLTQSGFCTRGGNKLTWTLGTSYKIDNMKVMQEFNLLFIHSGTKIYHILSDGTSATAEANTPYEIGAQLTAGYPSDFLEYNSLFKFSNGKEAYSSVAVAPVKTQFTQASSNIVLSDGYGANFTLSAGIKTAAFTADNTTDIITSAAHGLSNGDTVTLWNSGGALPAGLSAGVVYYVISSLTNTFQLSLTSGGAAVNFTTNGSGTNSFTNGIVWCKGNVIGYTTNASDTLGGTLTIPTGTYEVGQIVTQVSAVASAPKATILETVFEKIVGGAVTNTAGSASISHNEYYSQTTSVDTWSGGNSGFATFGKFGKITGMLSLLTYLYVAKDKGFEIWTDIDSNGIPVRKPFSQAWGVANPKCFKVMNDKLFFLTSQKQIKTIEPATIGFNPQPVINPNFDKVIHGTMIQIDDSQSNACAGFNPRDWLARVTVLQNGARQTIIHDELTGGFTVDKGYVPNCWIEWNGAMYYGSGLADGKIYRSETGFTDDTSAPKVDVLTPIHWVSDRRRKMPVGHVYITGLIMTQTKCTVTIYADGAQARQFVIDGAGSYVDTSSSHPFGRDYLGRDSFGYGGNEDGVNGFYFRVPIDVNLDARNIQLRFESQGIGYRIQVNSYEVVQSNSEPISETQDDIQ